MIYIFRERGTDNIKVGFTDKDVEERKKELQREHKCVLDLVHSDFGDRKTEAQLHRYFYRYRIHGRPERFSVPDHTIKRVLQLCVKHKLFFERPRQYWSYGGWKNKREAVKAFSDLLEKVIVSNNGRLGVVLAAEYSAPLMWLLNGHPKARWLYEHGLRYFTLCKVKERGVSHYTFGFVDGRGDTTPLDIRACLTSRAVEGWTIEGTRGVFGA